ncbi:MAG TPA: potassium transporter Trk [Oribacterium sp.]|jgi:trk system potassium uptake protein TrkA|nr:potassium transporter Trk [Oribacterium sp.]
MSDRKSFTVIGLGIFGSAVAKTFARAGMDVIAIDRNMLAVENVADTVENAVRADSTDIEQLKEAGVQSTDAAVIAMGSHLEESIITILNLKDLGVKEIIAKANNNNYKYVLEKIGATRVIQPEKEMGVRTASMIMTPNIRDLIQLDDQYAVVEMHTPTLWQEHSLKELNLRASFGINVIGLRHEDTGHLHMMIDASAPLKGSDILVMIVDREKFNKLKLT